MKYLINITQFEELLAQKSDFIVYKHSSTCNISDKACRTVGQIINELDLDEIYLLDVHITKNLKYEVADIMDVRHESPQVLLFKSGKLTASASHLAITIGRFRQHLIGWNDTRK